MSTSLAQSCFSRRPLPRKLIVGYASHTGKVRRAVEQGVNVVIWAFCHLKASNTSAGHAPKVLLETSLDLEAVQSTMKELDADGYDHVVHLVSFGGWNGPHIDENLSIDQWMEGFQKHLSFFHGLDWDLEGHDDLSSPTNIFTVECLQKMVQISNLAKQDGFVVGMAPPQSYLDVSSSRFCREVNLTDPDRTWHADFHYFGCNVYAYLLHECLDAIDFVSIQFYESYSRAALHVYDGGLSPADYMVQYVQDLARMKFCYYVDFSEDDALGLESSEVEIPESKLVLGLGNGWAAPEKNFVASGMSCVKTWKLLRNEGIFPKGFMFWTIDEEGNNGVELAPELFQAIFGSFTTPLETKLLPDTR